MKKIILAAVVSSALASSSFAGNYYAKGSLGLSQFGGQKDKFTDMELKSNKSMVAGAEFGYNVWENVRVGLGLGYHMSPKLEKAGTTKHANVVKEANSKLDDSVFKGAEATSSHSLSVMSLMLKGSFDVADFDMANVYVNAGVGMSRVSEKINLDVKEVAIDTTKGIEKVDAKKYTEEEIKAKNNLSFSFGAGVGFKMAEGVVANVGYDYLSYGKTGKKEEVAAGSKDAAKNFEGETALNAHVLSAGVRFEF